MTDISLKIIIDPSGAIKAVQQVEGSVNNLSNTLSKVNSPASILDDTFAKIGLRMQGFINIGQVVSRTFGNFIKESNAGEEALASLNQALKQQGIYSESTIENLKNYASELQNITGIDDDLTIKTMAQLTAMGLQGEQMKQATSLAQDLAAVMGTDLSAAARVMADAFNGNTGMLGRYIKGLDESDIKQRGMVSIIEQLTKAVGGQAESLGNTGAGALRKFNAAMADLKQSIGDLLKDVLTPFISLFTNWIKYMNDSSVALKALALGVISFAAVFALVNTSMGALPLVIGIVITSVTALFGALKNGEPIVAGIAAAIGALTIALVAVNAKLIFTSTIITTTLLPALTALKTAIMANPWLLLATAVIGAGVALYSFISARSKANDTIRESAQTAHEARLEFDKLQSLGAKSLELKLDEAKSQLKSFQWELSQANLEASRFTRSPLTAWFASLVPSVKENVDNLEGMIAAQKKYISVIESTIEANNKESGSAENSAKVKLELEKLKTQAMADGAAKRRAEINSEFELEKLKTEERKDLNNTQRADIIKALEDIRNAKLKSVDDDLAKREREQIERQQQDYTNYLDTRRGLDLQYAIAFAASEDEKTNIQRKHLETRIADLSQLGVLTLDQQTELYRNQVALAQLNSDEEKRIAEQTSNAKKTLRQIETDLISDEHKKRLTEIENYYAEEIEKAKNNAEAIKALQKAKNLEIESENQRHANQIRQDKLDALANRADVQIITETWRSGFRTGWDAIIDESRTGAQKWQDILDSIKRSAWSTFGSVLQKAIETTIAEMVFKKSMYAADVADHATAETTKTATSKGNALARVATAIWEGAKKIAVWIAETAVFLAQEAMKTTAAIANSVARIAQAVLENATKIGLWIAEQTAFIAKEIAMTVVAIAQTALRIASALAEAAVSIVKAVAKTIASMGPLGLILAPALIAAGVAVFAGLKSAFGFLEGGEFKEGERGYIEGKAKEGEIIAPKRTFKEVMTQDIVPDIIKTVRISMAQQTPPKALAGEPSHGKDFTMSFAWIKEDMSNQAASIAKDMKATILAIGETTVRVAAAVAESAVSITRTVAKAIIELGPLGLTIVPALLAGGIAVFSGLKSSFGFLEGGEFKEGERGYIEGKAKEGEIIAPKRTFKEVMTQDIVPDIIKTVHILMAQQMSAPVLVGTHSREIDYTRSFSELKDELREMKTLFRKKEMKVEIGQIYDEQRFFVKNTPLANRIIAMRKK